MRATSVPVVSGAVSTVSVCSPVLSAWVSGAVSTVSAVSGGTVACRESADEASGVEVPGSAVSRL